MLPDLFDSLGLNDPLTYLVVFLGVSLLMLWRLEAMLDHGLEGTALGTLIMPYCSGLGNLIFVAIMVARDGQLDRNDGVLLIGLFLFWQCFQVYDVLKHNIRQRVSFGVMFYIDALVVLACAYFLYETIDWLVTWLTAQKSGFVSAQNLGWLTGWLMVLPNAVIAFYWGWKRRADVVYTSQVGDGHISIPLCLGLFAVFKPLPVSEFFQTGLLILLGSVAVHGVLLLVTGGLPRWAGALLTLAYGWFVWQGLLS